MAETQEQWNMADATLKRLNRLLQQCSFYSQMNDLKSWFNVTMDLRRNLYPFLSDTDFEEVKKHLSSLPPEWKFYKSLPAQVYSQVYKVLDEVYMIFIITMRKNGLLLPKPIDTGKSILDM